MSTNPRRAGLNGTPLFQDDMEGLDDYVFSVQLGHKRNADVDKDVWVSLHSHSGETTGDILLGKFFSHDFNADYCHYITVKGKRLDDVDYIKLWHDTSLANDAWYVHRVEVLCKATGSRLQFPFNRWVKTKHCYTIGHRSTSLPIHDMFIAIREKELSEAREQYVLVADMPGLPPYIKTLPGDENYDCHHLVEFGKEGIDLASAATWENLVSKKWETLADLSDVYCQIFPVPEDVNHDIWQEDAYFGNQRLVGINPSVIQQCTAVPSQLGVEGDMLKPFLEGMDIKAAIEAKRIFVVDYSFLEGVPCQSTEWKLCAPIALFFVNKAKQLMPIAIQLFQKPSKTNPVFLPSDPKYTWMMAKLWFNHADGSYQESMAHLGGTHLLMEGFDVVTHRNLGIAHPIFKLLAPHFLYLLAINSLARVALINKGGIVDSIMSMGEVGMKKIIEKQLPKWRMDTQGTLPNDLQNRKVEADVLPGYYFRDDALLVYEAIKKYVGSYVAVYYADTPLPGSTLISLTSDAEIQAWVKAIIAPIKPSNGGCGIKGVPLDKSGDSISTTAQLTQILTSIIYTCSVGHAVVNFAQYEQYGFQPAYPLSMRGTPPTDKTKILEERDIMNAIPTKERTLKEMTTMKLLSTRNTNLLGNFEHDYIVDPPGVHVVNQFRADLKNIATIIDERNKTRATPYVWASPKYVPNAISI